ncbi:MAG: CRTAC1 family protein [Wenzhouxiangellaceae bacterium]
MTPREPRDRDDEWVADDDRVIGTALKWSAAALVLAGLLAAAGGWWLTRPAPPESVIEAIPTTPARTGIQASETPPEIPFTDVTEQAGIDFVHETGGYGLKLLPETMGSGAAFADFDADGDTDLLLVNGGLWPWHDYSPDRERPTHKLYLNRGDGRFVDATTGSGLDASFYGTAPVVGDFDGDGLPDVFIAAVGGNRMFRNLGGGRFADVTEASGVAGKVGDWSSCGAFFDADGDGDLDLFVCNYVEWSLDIDLAADYRLTGIGRAFGPPTNYAGTHNRLYRNNGDGTFTDVSARAGIEVAHPDSGRPEGKALAVIPVDINGDGLLDLVVANDTIRNFLFLNRGGTFEELGVETGLAFDPDGHATGAMGMDTTLVDGSGQRAIAIGNFSGEMTSFYLSQGTPELFADQSATSGIGPRSRQALTFGLFFFDADLDGRPDIFQANGHLEQEIHQVQPGQTYAQPPQLFWNCGNECPRRFLEAGGGDLGRPLAGRAAAYADIDNDGDQDILITQVGARPVLLRNDQQTGHRWLRVRLEQDGPNRAAIGAVVRLENVGTLQQQTIMPTRGYQAQVMPAAVFGLGDDPQVPEVVVTWPDGAQSRHPVTGLDRELVIRRARAGQ